jgi:hypothetical protein
MVLFSVNAPFLSEGTIVQIALLPQGFDYPLDNFGAIRFLGQPTPHFRFTSGPIGQEAQCGVLCLYKLLLAVR